LKKIKEQSHKNKRPPRHRFTNVGIILAAAKVIGCTITPITIGSLVHGHLITYKQRSFYLSCDAKKAFFPTLTRWQISLTSDKAICTQVLSALKYPQIDTVICTPSTTPTLQEIKKRIAHLPLPLIVKPTTGADGSGIELCRTQRHLQVTLARLQKNRQDFLVQPFIEQPEYRITTINGTIAFIHRKKFPEIIGDGQRTILELLRLTKYQNIEVVNHECKKRGYTLKSVLTKDEAMPINITKKTDTSFYLKDDFPPALVRWTKALCAKLNIDILGIDIFIEGDLKRPKVITIIELNSKPGLDYICDYFNDNQTPITIASTMLRKFFQSN